MRGRVVDSPTCTEIVRPLGNPNDLELLQNESRQASVSLKGFHRPVHVALYGNGTLQLRLS